ncbi:hypothetical protein [Kitasatospora phosalacinea]|uniref:hypothetical protein n=1 Tax=Kitasatospora phosalacinea TaxID=2065 RepID=UPI0005242FC3|nr:hypothetical protein [Kitasatospora phosalacinea]
MSQRRSYPNSGDFNLDDLFRPEPAADGQGSPAQAAAQPPYAQPQSQAPVPQQQSAPPLGQSGSPEYWGTPPQQAGTAPQQPAPGDEGATQYLPPYPAGGPAVGGAAQPAPPAFAQQPQPAPYAAQPTYGGGGYGAPQQGYAPAPDGYPQQAADGGRRKPNTKVLIGAGVAGVALVAVLVGVLASGGDKKDKDTAKGGATSGQSVAAPSPNGGNAAVTPEMKAQAQALSDLLGTASAGRTSVVNAVAAVGKCQNLPDSQAALASAASQRQGLLTKLGALKVDQLTEGAELVKQLQAAWQASATADSEYAQWAGDLVAGCDPAKAKDNAHLRNGDAASGTATTAKKQASELWGTIATKTGLPAKSAGEL